MDEKQAFTNPIDPQASQLIKDYEEDDAPILTPALQRGAEVIRGYLDHLSDGAGVYRMIDRAGKVLYVGKAKSLVKRVRSYTHPNRQSLRIQRMISATHSMEFLLTANEVEALLLENNLIKHYRPPFNVLLRDDKTHLELFIGDSHEFPQLQRHRGAHRKTGRYFGPYASALAVRQTINMLERLFLLRNCQDSVFKNRNRPCLQYQIKRCSAPCVGYISKEAYHENIKRAEQFLKGQGKALIGKLEEEMREAAQARDYERAASLRDRVRSLMQIQLDQELPGSMMGDMDLIALVRIREEIAIQIIYYRGGRHNGNQVHYLKPQGELSDGEFMRAFIGQLYHDLPPPPTILLSHEPTEIDLVADALSQLADQRVKLSVPKRGNKRMMMDNALQNASAALSRKRAKEAVQHALLEELAKLADIDRPINRIEVYDNSHLLGTNPIGAMIVATPDGFEKASYRTFNIRNQLEKAQAKQLPVGARPKNEDDYAMMHEVLTRRFTNLIKEIRAADEAQSQPSPPIPDIILIDGGIGQLRAAQQSFEALEIPSILPQPPCLIAVAKGEDRNAGRERLFMETGEIISLPTDSELLYFIQRLRDEAHRFAIGTQRKRRKQGDFENPLDQIEGIGASRKKKLMLYFGSARGVSGAGVKDLLQVPGISEQLAQTIYDHFHPNA